MKRRFLAWLLCAVMLFNNALPVFATEGENIIDENIHICDNSCTERCPTCGEHDCTKEHTTCTICGALDCKKEHIQCGICNEYDCVKEHKECEICSTVDCTADHAYCETCEKYDCGETHQAEPTTCPDCDAELVEGETHTCPPSCNCGETHDETNTDCPLYVAPKTHKEGCTLDADHEGDCVVEPIPDCECGAFKDENGNIEHADDCSNKPCEHCEQVGDHAEGCPALCICGDEHNASDYNCPLFEGPRYCECDYDIETLEHESGCHVPVAALHKKLMKAETAEEMYEKLIEAENTAIDLLIALTFDEINELQGRIAELYPEEYEAYTTGEYEASPATEVLDYLTFLPNSTCPDCGLSGMHTEECPRKLGVVFAGSGTASGTMTGDEFLEKAKNGYLQLAGDVTVTSTIKIKGTTLVLDLNGYVLERSSWDNIKDFDTFTNDNLKGQYGRVIEITEGGSLTIEDSNPTKKNAGSLVPVSRWIDKRLEGSKWVNNDGKTIYSSSEIYTDRYYWETTDTNEFWEYDGKGTTIIEGGIITGGAYTSGAGILVQGGTLTINGGTIAGNRSVRYITLNTKVEGYEGQEIQEATAGNGGGIYANLGAKVTMNGGSIRYNWTDYLGGGVCTTDKGTVFTMNSGDITENCAQGSGGGATIRGRTSGTGIYEKYIGSSVFELGPDPNNEYTKKSVPVVQDNKTYSSRYHGGGGGMEVDGGSLTYVTGQIKDNTAKGSGGGIYCYRGGSVNASTSNSIISGNKASGGGGIFLQYGDVILDDVILTDNTVTGSGGAVGIRVGNFQMTGGLIEGNYAGNNGGGVYVTAQNNYTPHNDNGNLGCSASITGTTVTGNKAGDHGGAIYVSVINSSENVTVTVNGCEITSNHAGVEKDNDDGLGGAIFLEGGTLTVKGNTIVKDNSAHGGGAFYVADRVRKIGYNSTTGKLLTSVPYIVDVEKLRDAYDAGVFKTEPALDENGYWNITLTDEYLKPYEDTKPGKVIIESGTFTNNKATKSNGGLMYVLGTVEIHDGTFTGNTAVQHGGAAYVRGNVTINHGILNNNTAGTSTVKGNGGAVYLEGDANTVLKFESGQMNNNSATDDGGAIYATAGTLYIGLDECDGNPADNTKHTFTTYGKYHPQIQSNMAGDCGGGIAISKQSDTVAGVVHFYCGHATDNDNAMNDKGIGKNVFMDGGEFYFYDGTNVGLPRDPDLVIVGGTLHDNCEKRDFITLKYYATNNATTSDMEGMAEVNEVMNLPNAEVFFPTPVNQHFAGWTAKGAASGQEFVRNRGEYVASGSPVEIVDAEYDSLGNASPVWDNNATDDTIHLYALWVNESYNIHYANILNYGAESNTPDTYDVTTLDVSTEIPAITKPGYVLKGWYVYQNEGQNANWGLEPVYKSGTTEKILANLDYAALEAKVAPDLQYLPVSDNGTLVLPTGNNTFGDITLIADYDLAYSDLKITKTGANDLDEYQTFIFNIENKSLLAETGNTVTNPDKLAELNTVKESLEKLPTVMVAENGSVTITHLPLGTYTVAEDENWSWRYSASSVEATVNDDGVPDIANVVNQRDPNKVYWMDGNAWCRNIFGDDKKVTQKPVPKEYKS